MNQHIQDDTRETFVLLLSNTCDNGCFLFRVKENVMEGESSVLNWKSK